MSKVRTYILAYLDVLGFSNLVEKKGLDEVYSIYKNLIENVKTVANIYEKGCRCVNVPVSKDVMGAAFSVGFNFEYTYVSDTIAIWCEFNRFNIEPFLECINTLFCSALEAEIPLRGTISFGDAILSKSESIYIGKPIIEGAECEKSQAWQGISFGHSLSGNVKFGWLGDLKNIIHHQAHLKSSSGKESTTSKYQITNIVLDWPRLARTEGKSEKISKWLNSKANDTSLPEKVRGYYISTALFMKYSQENSDWPYGFDFQRSRLGGYFVDHRRKVTTVFNSEEEWSNNIANVRMISR